ncbi:amino acid transporter amino acid-binding protein [Streptococcus macacae NCTC 11558]|nr:amino acid transporter amino acid-binding protein [Streptococcus macacae NCTC 11558]
MKKIGLLLLSFLAAILLVACTSSNSNNLENNIKNKKKLVVAVSPDYAPFEFKALMKGKDTIVGADIKLAKEIADELGVKLELSSMSFDNVLSSLKTGKADIAISGLSYTKERAKAYDFSTPYYKTENAILVKKSDLNKYTSLSSFNKAKVAVQKGTIEEKLTKDQLSQSNVTALTAMGEAVNELKSGQVDAIDLEKPVAEGYLTQNKELAIAKVALKTGEGDSKAVALPKNSGKLVKTVNKVIKKLKKEGKYKQYISESAQLTDKQVKD